MKTQNKTARKKIWLSMLLSFSWFKVLACDACKKQQPKFLQGISHGTGPENAWDYLIVVIMVVITVYVLIATIKCLIKPSEHNNEHIKRIILND